MTREEVAAAVGQPGPGSGPSVYYYHDSCFQVNFDDEGKVTYIELSWCPSQFQVQWNEHSVFDLTADDVVRILTQEGPGVEEEDGHSYVFYDMDVGLWRPVLPSDYQPEDVMDEYRNGKYWTTIGVGFGSFFRDKKSPEPESPADMYERLTGTTFEEIGIQTDPPPATRAGSAEE